MSDAVDGAADLASDLRDARRTAQRARERVAEAGGQRLERLENYHGELLGLFDRYEEEATGDGDFAVFIEFQEAMASFVERLPEDLPYYERFEAVDDLMQQRRLTESDFAAAREELAPVAEEVGLLDERDAAEKRYRELETRARKRVREIEARIADLEDLQRLGEADLEAPIEELREPIEAYNDTVADAFATFKHEASTREVLSFVAATTAFPLVPFRDPPTDLRTYVDERPAGEESIPQLLEYAEYSGSKLDHYVADADALKRTIGANRTYLRRLDAEPLTVAWPPPPADRLRWRLRELIQVTGRFAPDAVVAQLRELRALPDDQTWYERLRDSARAREQLTDEQRRRLAAGAVADELERAREAKADLTDALDG